MGGIIPVYLGAPNAPNVTRTPSYINAMHFSSPKELAQYLLHLEKHPEEYDRYNEWRDKPELFHPAYLKLVQRQMPGQEEMRPLREKGVDHMARRAACCRLCDENFVREAAQRRTLDDLVHGTWSSTMINHRLFAGSISSRPGPRARLDPDPDL